MGTRSLTHIHAGDLKSGILLTIYHQFDGYPGGVGEELATFLGPIEVVNGISDRSRPIANGMGCLAAQLVKHLKDGVGNVYIYPAGSKDCWEEYVYHIYVKDLGPVYLRCERPDGALIADGLASEFMALVTA